MLAVRGRRSAVVKGFGRTGAWYPVLNVQAGVVRVAGTDGRAGPRGGAVRRVEGEPPGQGGGAAVVAEAEAWAQARFGPPTRLISTGRNEGKVGPQLLAHPPTGPQGEHKLGGR